MCVAKKTVVIAGVERQVVCNKCWSCRLVRANDWLGRAIAEARCADHVLVATLTYADDPSISVQFDETVKPAPDRTPKRARGKEVSEAFGAASIVKRDWQRYMKRLRNGGVKYWKDDATGKWKRETVYTVRYLAASEF